MPAKTVEQILGLYREQYFVFNVRRFHEKLSEEHGIQTSYTWVKRALQEAGMLKKREPAGGRERRPLPGMLLHIRLTLQ